LVNISNSEKVLGSSPSLITLFFLHCFGSGEDVSFEGVVGWRGRGRIPVDTLWMVFFTKSGKMRREGFSSRSVIGGFSNVDDGD
jgi:hypothetical protein